MGKGTIIRIPTGVTLPPEVKLSLPGLLPKPHIEELFLFKTPNHTHSFKCRMQSLHKGFVFFLNAYPFPETPLRKETLLKQAYNELEYYQLHSGGKDFDNARAMLVAFTSKLANLIITVWGCSPSEAITLLNEAEQYAIMCEGRQNTATISPLLVGEETQYIVQVDESLIPYDTELLQDLTQIRARSFVKTPTWFRELDEALQVFLAHLDQMSTRQEECIALLEQLASVMQVNSLPPERASNLHPALQQMLTILLKDGYDLGVKRLDGCLTKLRGLFVGVENFTAELNGLSQQPLWYLVLPKHQQYFLEHALSGRRSIRDCISFIPSRLRTMPGTSNFATHTLYIIDSTGKVEKLGNQRFRSSHIASRDGLTYKYPSSIQNRLCTSTWNIVTAPMRQDCPVVLMQTLISPFPGAAYMQPVLSPLFDFPPDLELWRLGRENVNRSALAGKTVQTNHPFNALNRIFPTQPNDSDCLQLLERARAEASEENVSLHKLILQYEALLNSGIGSSTVFDYAGRELWLSSLEQLIIFELNGYSYGSCVSGKDRKAVESLHTDAMLLYRKLKGQWPHFNDATDVDASKRQLFASIFSDLYHTRHHQELASQNAPGAQGIKTPKKYIPEYICSAIKEGAGDILVCDDKLASTNEVKSIVSASYLSGMPSQLPELMALQLGDDGCQMLYNSLSCLLNEERLFTVVKSSIYSPYLPRGIKEMIALMRNVKPEPIMERVARVIEIALERPEANETRTEATNAVYNGVRALCGFHRPIIQLSDLIDSWTERFNSAKAARVIEAPSRVLVLV